MRNSEIQPASPASKRRKACRGGSLIEMVLILPWIFFLFIGALDWGFYSSALVSLQAAARTAALYTSGGDTLADDSSTACTLVLDEIRKLPNIGSSVTGCGSNPIVTAEKLSSGPDGAEATRVTVTYQTISMIPIPGLLAKQFTINRSVTMRVRS